MNLRLTITAALVLPALVAQGQTCHPFWTGTGSPIASRMRDQAVVFDDGSGPHLYVSGMRWVGAFLAPGVARWDGREWEMLDSGYPQSIQSGHLLIADFGPGLRLYAGGGSDTPQGWAWWLREWDGGGWRAVPPEYASTESGWPYFFLDQGQGAALYGLSALTPQHNNIVRWNGTTWDVIGIANRHATLFESYDDGNGPALYVAGTFTSIDNIPLNGIAKWTGTDWHPLGAGITDWRTPRDMRVHDDGSGPALYICDVEAAGGQSINRIARWNGHGWSDVGGGGIMSSGITAVYSLGSFDDGRGPALYVGGYLNLAGGGVPVRGIARFDGTSWDNMLGGTFGGFPHDFVPFDDGRGPSLFAVGYFHTVGGGAENSARGVAQWVGCQEQCYANCDNSAVAPRLNVDDFTCFINKFAHGDPYVDCNQDGVRDIADFHCFIARFVERCE